MENNKFDYISLTTLKKEYGFTDSIIKKLNVKPCFETRNPKYRTAAPMKLFAKSKIQHLVVTPEFLVLYNKNAPRREAAAKIRAAKEAEEKAAFEIGRKSFLIKLESIDPRFHTKMIFTESELAEKALKQRERHRSNFSYLNDYDPEDYEGVSFSPRESHTEFMKRTMKNYVRHQLMNYDKCIGLLDDPHSLPDDYSFIKSKFMTLIDERYPFLADDFNEELSIQNPL